MSAKRVNNKPLLLSNYIGSVICGLCRKVRVLTLYFVALYSEVYTFFYRCFDTRSEFSGTSISKLNIPILPIPLTSTSHHDEHETFF